MDSIASSDQCNIYLSFLDDLMINVFHYFIINYNQLSLKVGKYTIHEFFTLK